MSRTRHATKARFARYAYIVREHITPEDREAFVRAFIAALLLEYN